jgi:peptide/nickel transport system permease protein
LPLLKFIVRRLLLGILILFAVTVLVFLATVTLPGNAAVIKLGRSATPASLKAFQAEYHLSQPFVTQYLSWLGHLLGGNLGVSLTTSLSVSTLIGQRIVNSLVLMLVTSVIAIPLAILVGVWSATHRDGPADHGLSLGLLALAGLPEFVVSIGLIVLLATNVLHILPAASLVDPTQSIFSQLKYVVLPALALALVSIPYVARMIRASMVEVLESDYVAMARLKGVRERQITRRHAVINAAGPTVQAIGLTMAYMAGGAVIVETVFQYPGIGLALYNAIQNRDLPVIQALTLLIAAAYVLLYISADVVTVMISPRLRTQLK